MPQFAEMGDGGGSSDGEHAQEHGDSRGNGENEHDQSDRNNTQGKGPHQVETVEVIGYRERYHANAHDTGRIGDKQDRSGGYRQAANPAWLADVKSRSLVDLYLQQATVPTRAWCGSGLLEPITPELFPESCMYHDLCYETLGESRYSCDVRLLENALREHPSFGKAAWAFFAGVRLGGVDAYEKAQTSSKEQQRRWPRTAQ